MESEVVQYNEVDFGEITSNLILEVKHENGGINADETISQIYLNEKECQALETWGYVVVSYDNKRYLLGNDGMKELKIELDIDSITSDSKIFRVQDSTVDEQPAFSLQVSTIPEPIEDQHNEYLENPEQSIENKNEICTKSPSIENCTNDEINLNAVDQINEISTSIGSDGYKFAENLRLIQKEPKRLKKVYSSKRGDLRNNLGKGVENGSDKFPEKILLGATPQGKQLFGRIVDFRPSNGTELSKSQLKDLSCKIKNTFKKINLDQVDVEKITQGKAIDSNAQLDKIVNISESELNAELATIKNVINLLLPLQVNVPIVGRNLMIYKVVSSNKSNHVKEYVFTGRMVGSEAAGWEFSYMPELQESDSREQNFLIIRITMDDDQKNITIENKDGNLSINLNMEMSDDDDKAQPTNDNLKKEVTRVHGKKYYECRYCKHFFFGLTNFKRHLKIHGKGTTEPAYKCFYCNCIFTYHGTRTRHMVKAHRNIATYTVES